jgi:hypothetical protein
MPQTEDTVTRPRVRRPAARPSLVPIRFGEYLCERNLLSDEQLLDVLADHWSNGGKIGTAVSRRGFLPAEVVEREAALYHGLEIVEV